MKVCRTLLYCCPSTILEVDIVKTSQRFVDSCIRNSSNPLREAELGLVQGLACSTEPRLVCLPTLNTDSLFTVGNIYQSFQSARPACQHNPCAAGRWPWLRQDGLRRCLPSSGQVSCDWSGPGHVTTMLISDWSAGDV